MTKKIKLTPVQVGSKELTPDFQAPVWTSRIQFDDKKEVVATTATLRRLHTWSTKHDDRIESITTDKSDMSLTYHLCD